MGPMDALSQKDSIDTSEDNLSQILLPNLQINMLKTALTNKIAKSTPSDQFIINTVAALNAKTIPLPHSQRDNWYFNQGTLYYKSHLYITEPTHHPLVKNIHKSLVGAHSGYFHTISLLQRDYWWPGMSIFVQRFISGCATCQANKINTHPLIPLLSPILSKCIRPFQQISMDLISDLPPFHGFDSILVVVDHGLSKGVNFHPCNKTASAMDIAKIFFQHIFLQFSLHDHVISD